MFEKKQFGENELDEGVIESIEEYGVARDFINELPQNLNSVLLEQYIGYRKENRIRTYTQRCEEMGKIKTLERSDPDVVRKIDGLVEEIAKAIESDNRQMLIGKTKEIYAIFKTNLPEM